MIDPQMDPKRYRRVSIIWWTIGLLMVSFVVYQIGFWNGRSHSLLGSMTESAKAVYEVQQKSGAQGLPGSILGERARNGLVEFEQKFGKVISFSVVYADSAPLGLPIVVSLEVKRTSGTKVESLIAHGPNWFESVQREE